MRSKTEVAAEIKKLQEMKPYVRRRTFFGDDNHEGIDAQLLVLTNWMDNDRIFDTWPEPDPDDDEADEYESVRGHALAALEWLEGDVEDAPSDDWAPLDSRSTERIQ